MLIFAFQAAIFNASGRFVRKPFLELTEDEFSAGLDVSGKGAFLFAQATLPRLVGAASASKHPPSLIFTGATASVKANPQLASFATGKWALRALSQSLAKEFGPQGVHVSHAIIDGVIDIPRTKEWLKDAGPDAKISADGVSLPSLMRRIKSSANVAVRLPMPIGTFTLSPGQLSHGRLISGHMLRSGKGLKDMWNTELEQNGLAV